MWARALITPFLEHAAPASKKTVGRQLVGEAGVLEIRETAKHGDHSCTPSLSSRPGPRLVLFVHGFHLTWYSGLGLFLTRDVCGGQVLLQVLSSWQWMLLFLSRPPSWPARVSCNKRCSHLGHISWVRLVAISPCPNLYVHSFASKSDSRAQELPAIMHVTEEAKARTCSRCYRMQDEELAERCSQCNETWYCSPACKVASAATHSSIECQALSKLQGAVTAPRAPHAQQCEDLTAARGLVAACLLKMSRPSDWSIIMGVQTAGADGEGRQDSAQADRLIAALGKMVEPPILSGWLPASRWLNTGCSVRIPIDDT